MNCKLFGKTAVFLMMLAICLLFAPAASAAGTTTGSTQHTVYENSIIIPEDVTTIEEEAFYGCSAIYSVTIPASVTSIGKGAFYGCTNLTRVFFAGTQEQWQAISIGADNTPLTAAAIQCSDSSSGTWGSLYWTLDDIGKLTVYGSGPMDDFLGDIYYHDGFPAWRGNKAMIRELEIIEGVTSVGEYAFKDCKNLGKITIPSSVKSIGNWAFCDCERLAELEFPSGMTDIGKSAFGSCASLRSVWIPASVTNLGSNAFGGCTSLRYAIIQADIAAIPETLFDYCKSLSYVAIPATVRSIGDYAFDDCILQEVYFGGSEEQWREISIGSNNRLPWTIHYNNDASSLELRIIDHPSDVRAAAGSEAVFAVTALGNNLSYQWQVRTGDSGTWENTAESGSMTATLTVPVEEANSGYQFRCVVSDNVTTLYTDTATLTVSTKPEITGIVVYPANGIVTGTTAGHASIPNLFTITVNTEGSELQYSWQWREKGASTWNSIDTVPMFIQGNTTSNSIELHTAEPALNGHSYEFICIVSNDDESVDSDIITIQVVDIN